MRPRTSRVKLGPDRGFTLIEILLAVSTLAVVVLMATGALRVGLRAWESGQRRVDLQQEGRALVELISDALAGASPYQGRLGISPERVVLFEGEPDEVRFVTNAPPLMLDAPAVPVPRGRPRAQGTGRTALGRASGAFGRTVRAGLRAGAVPVGDSLHPRVPGRVRSVAGAMERARGWRAPDRRAARARDRRARPRDAAACGRAAARKAGPSDGRRPSRTETRRGRRRADRGAPAPRPASHDRRRVQPRPCVSRR